MLPLMSQSPSSSKNEPEFFWIITQKASDFRFSPADDMGLVEILGSTHGYGPETNGDNMKRRLEPDSNGGDLYV